MTRWLLLSGELPPDPGGVADYTAIVARGLSERGHEVHVAAPQARLRDVPFQVHSLPDSFGPRGLQRLGRLLEELPGPLRVFLQYVPHAYGYKALNFGLPAWLAARDLELWTLFHEVAYPYEPPLWRKTNALALGHRAMARLVAGASRRRFVTTRRWDAILEPLGCGPTELLPVPSNVSTSPAPERVAAWRARHPDVQLLGHFGTYGRLIGPLLERTLPRLLDASPRVHVLLLGRKGVAFRERLCAEHSWLSRRVHASGELSSEEVAAAIQACDLMLQPYEDGVTSRRGSLMACLGVGAAVLSSDEPRVEASWRSESAVALEPFAAGALAIRAAQLLEDPERLAALRSGAQALYDARFALERTLDVLTAS